MKTIFYARVSDNSCETNTIENQINIIKQYYNKKIKCNLDGKSNEKEIVYKDGMDIEVEIIIDRGYSGTNMNRPGMIDILTKLEGANIGAIVAKDISRISRNYIDLGVFIKKCILKGVKLITVAEGDYTREHDYFMKDMKGLLADMYSKDISIKVKSALDVRKEKGIYAFPQLPFGYIKVNGKIEIEREEAKIVRYIYDNFKKEKSISCVKKTLDREGVFTPREYMYIKKMLENDIKWLDKYKKMNLENKVYVWDKLKLEKRLWSCSTIRKILTNEFYTGTMVYNKTVREDWGSKRRVKSGLEKQLYNHHVAIISKDLFIKIQRFIGINDDTNI